MCSTGINAGKRRLSTANVHRLGSAPAAPMAEDGVGALIAMMLGGFR